MQWCAAPLIENLYNVNLYGYRGTIGKICQWCGGKNGVKRANVQVYALKRMQLRAITKNLLSQSSYILKI